MESLYAISYIYSTVFRVERFKQSNANRKIVKPFNSKNRGISEAMQNHI